MKKITRNAIDCFNRFENFKNDNTIVKVYKNHVALLLFHNVIARKYFDGKLMITNCGWFTNTTKERLNGINGVHIIQKKGEWYLNGKHWNGNLIEIN